MEFEWDLAKAAENKEKHGVSFEDAMLVFADPNVLTFSDADHSVVEAREITIGKSGEWLILLVSYADRSGRIRIIPARKATKKEAKLYE